MKNQNSLIFLCLLVILLSVLLSKLSLSFASQSVPQSKPSLEVKPLATAMPPEKTTLLAVGDVMLGRFVNITSQRNKDYRYPFIKTAELLNSADITFGNLETPLIADCPVTATGMIFCAPNEAVEGLVYAGFDLLSIANNHIYNYGKDGRQKTIEFLEQNSITPSFESLVIKEVNNLKFGFLSFDLITYPNTPVVETVKKYVSQVNVLIVSLHWGAEYKKLPTDSQKELARKIIDSGAKIIIGHHPHVIQPVEEYGQGLIFYSLGNFVFDQPWSEETKKGQIAKIVFTGKEIESYKSYPVYIKDSQPFLAD